LTKENDQHEQDGGTPPCRKDFTELLIGITVTGFCVWIINSYESAQQGYKWAIFGLVTLLSGGWVFGSICIIIEKWFKFKTSYRFKKSFYRFKESLSYFFLGLILNWTGVSRLYESFERSDANNDGLFTITDLGVHAKETFFATGDLFTIWIANTSVGQFFEMNTITPSPNLAFIVSFFLWFSLYLGLKTLITDED
jgi:hypothetical protein